MKGIRNYIFSYIYMDNLNKNLPNENIFKLEPEELLYWLNQNFNDDVPIALNTTQELKDAGELLGKLMNVYSYLNSLSLHARLQVRNLKKNKSEKEEIDKAIDRKEILSSYADTIKLRYNAVSRMITVRKQVEDELKML
jgi:hypothetical protein